MQTDFYKIGLKQIGGGWQISAFVVSPILNRHLEAWIAPNAPTLAHWRSNNPAERQEAYIKFAEMLLEQNGRYDEYAGTLFIHTVNPF
jgi:hypothetical protein